MRTHEHSEGVAAAPNRQEWMVVLALLMVHGVLAWFHVSKFLPVGRSDPSRYYFLAQSLAEDGGYRVRTVPPGFSLSLVPVVRIFGGYPDSVGAVQIQIVLMGCLGLLLAYRFARFRLNLGFGCSLGLLAVSGLNPHLIELHGAVMSESTFLALFWGVLLLGTQRERTTLELFGLSLLSFLAFWVRTLAVVLFPALFLLALAQRDRKLLLASSVTCALSLVSWGAWLSTSHPGNNTYLKELSSSNLEDQYRAPFDLRPAAGRWIRQFKVTLSDAIPGQLFPIITTRSFKDHVPDWIQLVLGWGAGIAVLSMILWSGVKWTSGESWVIGLSVIAYGFIICCWWFPPHRFITPMLPTIWMLVCLALQRHPRLRGALLIVSWLVCLVVVARQMGRLYRFGHPWGSEAAQREQAVARAYNWVKGNTSRDDHLSTDREWQLSLMTQRVTRSVWAESRASILDGRFTYVVFTDPLASSLDPIPEQFDLVWQEEFGNRRILIFRIQTGRVSDGPG